MFLCGTDGLFQIQGTGEDIDWSGSVDAVATLGKSQLSASRFPVPGETRAVKQQESGTGRSLHL